MAEAVPGDARPRGRRGRRAALDLDELAARRWYASKGEVPSSARLAHAFALAPDAVLALVDLRVGERLERYAVPFVLRDGSVREAHEGDGAWRAVAAAIADGRAIPALARDAAAAARRWGCRWRPRSSAARPPVSTMPGVRRLRPPRSPPPPRRHSAGTSRTRPPSWTAACCSRPTGESGRA